MNSFKISSNVVDIQNNNNDTKTKLHEYNSSVHSIIQENDTNIRTIVQENDTNIRTIVQENDTNLRSIIQENDVDIRVLLQKNDTNIRSIIHNGSSKLYDKIVDTSVSLRMYTETYSAVGSGFIFKHSGQHEGLYIGTAAHCVMSDTDTRDNIQTQVFVVIYNYNKTGNSRVFKCEIVGVAGYMDFAVLKIVGGDLSNHNYLEFETDSEFCKIGDKCYMCGNPLGYDALSYCEGNMRDNSFWFHYDLEFISFSTPVYPGNSGSCVLNSRGNIIGIVSYGMSNGDNFNFGAKYTHLLQASKHICSTKSNYVGGTIKCNLSPVEIVYLKVFNRLDKNVAGYYIYDNKNSNLSDYDMIENIDNKELGILPNQFRPSIIYEHPSESLSFQMFNPFTNTTFTKLIYIDPIPEQQDVYIGHSGTQNYSFISNCNLIGPCKIDIDIQILKNVNKKLN